MSPYNNDIAFLLNHGFEFADHDQFDENGETINIDIFTIENDKVIVSCVMQWTRSEPRLQTFMLFVDDADIDLNIDSIESLIVFLSVLNLRK